MSGPSNAPVIIKRKKVVAGGGHHGGAWKVAYADFVTAMMAFFLLMWLLGATNEKQRKGIADFFNPTVPVNKVSGGGDGAFGGDSVFTEQTLSRNGTGADSNRATEENASRGNIGPGVGQGAEDGQTPGSDGEDAVFAELEQELAGIGGESMVTELLMRHVTSRITDEGLIVELFDREAAPLFDDAGRPTTTLDNLVAGVADVFAQVGNGIAIQGHVAAVPVVARESRSWETSTERAGLVRELMEAQTIAPGRIQRVTGFADRRPVTTNPLSGRNNRIEIVLLRSKI
ncbi:MAG: flagellar motor protein MotB [Paracoccaceae bacterium]|nr:flagellar motor protein MotB [Paracoccaceae bacterium]